VSFCSDEEDGAAEVTFVKKWGWGKFYDTHFTKFIKTLLR